MSIFLSFTLIISSIFPRCSGVLCLFERERGLAAGFLFHDITFLFFIYDVNFAASLKCGAERCL